MPRPNAAGRAAALWQTILGAILLLIGTCVGAIALLPESLWKDIVAQQQSSFPEIENTSIHAMRIMATFSSVIFFSVGLLLLILSFFVRRESRGAIIASIAINGLFGSFMLTDFVSAASNLSNPTTILPILMLLAILGLCVVTILKLVAVMRGGSNAQAQAMQQAWYWMQQQQQAGAGYGQPPPGYGSGYNQNPLVAPPPPPPQQQPALPPQKPPPAPPSGEV